MEKITQCSVFLGNLELLIMGLLQPKKVLYIYFANISSWLSRIEKERAQLKAESEDYMMQIESVSKFKVLNQDS